MRPYIPVSKIPNFDPTNLPYWSIYEREGKTDTIKVGGTMAGEFTAGLSGGQRKLLLFELICQRMRKQSELLICLDEPFAGVTDDFVPFIVERLEELRKKHNIILVTNDHVNTLTNMADNTITVSAIDRTKVKINDLEGVDRQRAIFALSLGDEYAYESSGDDLKFFFDVEVFSNGALFGVVMFSLFSFGLFLLSFWDSAEDQAALVAVAGGMISFFCVQPYVLTLVEWRNAMEEEAEALMHSSKDLNRTLKTLLTVFMIFAIAWGEYGIINACINGLEAFKYWVAMFFDTASMIFPLICLGVYTHMDFQSVQLLGSLPFLFMIFFSTTFSPGAGVEGVKELRYLFARFYYWCMLPDVGDVMDGCPEDNNLLYLILSALIGVFLFLVVQLVLAFQNKSKSLEIQRLKESLEDEAFHQLQITMYGEKALKRLNHMASSVHSKKSNHSNHGGAVVEA